MKRLLLVFCIAFTGFGLLAQDAAVEERLSKINGTVQDLLAAQAEQQKRIAALAAELRSLRDEQSRPNTSYASHEELRKLAEKLAEIDRKREADKDLILKEIEKLGKTLKTAPVSAPRPASTGTASASPDKSYEGYEYTIQQGDTLSGVVQRYREEGIKVSVDDILKHPQNPNLNPNRLQVGQKIFIPAPTQR